MANTTDAPATAEIEYHTIPTFHFTNGTALTNVRVAYRQFHPPTAPRGTILIPTCFGGRLSTTLTFTTPPYDALRGYRVVVAAMLGNGESSSPSNTPGFPAPGDLRYEDVVRAHHHLLAVGLGVETLDAVVGFSMGGQQAFHWAVMYPAFVKRIVCICGSARTSPQSYALIEGASSALLTSVDYPPWAAAKRTTPPPRLGLLAFGRALTPWWTSGEWFRRRLWQTSLGFATVDAWVEHDAQDSLAWDADDYLALARMWQMGDIGQTARGALTSRGWRSDDGALVDALRGIRCPVLLMPCSSDQLFDSADSAFEAEQLEGAQLAVIESCWGHLAGGGACHEDAVFMSDRLERFLYNT